MSPAGTNQQAIRLMMVDDSRTFLRMAETCLAGFDSIQVVGTAGDGVDALAKLEALAPDVMSLDLHMPEMGGLEVLESLQKLADPPPVIVVSSQTSRGAEASLEALRLGAIEFILKPVGSLQAFGMEFASRVIMASAQRSAASATTGPAVLGPEIAPSDFDVLLIASSTGGPVALESLLSQIPASFPLPIVIVQHMPVAFTAELARALDKLSPLHVEEARDGLPLRPGHVVLARGGVHLGLSSVGQDVVCQLVDQQPENGCRPAADVTFRAASEQFGRRTLALVLTGMGQDSLEGCRHIKRGGGRVLVQDEASCVVFGMPGSVVRAGLHDAILPLERIPSALARRFSSTEHRL